MKRSLLLLIVSLLSFGPLAALAGPPKTFLRGEASQWQVFELRSDVDFQHAWDNVYDILVKDFDIAVAYKEDGYIRTDWLYSFGGKYNYTYRVRATVRFSADRKAVRVKTDAQFLDGKNWLIGVDSRLLTTLKTDLMGTIGRTTR
jgi:hypothetical protein